MRAVLMQESKVPAFVLKEDQFFSQDLDQQWQVSDLLGHRDRMPIAPQILTTGRSPGDMREFGILSPVLLAVVTGKTLWFFCRHFLIKFSENAGRYHFQCAQGISASNCAGWLALSSQGIKLKVTGDSVSLGHLPKRHILAVANIINRHGAPAKERAPDFTAIHCLPGKLDLIHLLRVIHSRYLSSRRIHASLTSSSLSCRGKHAF